MQIDKFHNLDDKLDEILSAMKKINKTDILDNPKFKRLPKRFQAMIKSSIIKLGASAFLDFYLGKIERDNKIILVIEMYNIILDRLPRMLAKIYIEPIATQLYAILQEKGYEGECGLLNDEELIEVLESDGTRTDT